MTIRYISDLHFYHDNIIKFDSRPFSSVGEMNEKLIENWNSVVKPGDITNILGDFCWSSHESDWASILTRLNGEKNLILGNHDKMPGAKLRKLFVDIKDKKEMTDGDRRVIMSHYPELFYKKAYDPKTFMLCGHIHITREDVLLEIWREQLRKSAKERGDNLGQIINVGCMKDYMGYTPRTLDELIERTGVGA